MNSTTFWCIHSRKLDSVLREKIGDPFLRDSFVVKVFQFKGVIYFQIEHTLLLPKFSDNNDKATPESVYDKGMCSIKR